MLQSQSIALGVNIDHVASVRQARHTLYPDVLQAALVAEQAGADAITIHLREDRRHIQDQDLAMLTEHVQTRLNLEMAVTDEMIAIAARYRPADCCLVPEKRQELTTEGGLDVCGRFDLVRNACMKLREAGVRVSIFVDPDLKQIEAAGRAGAPVIEIHTGRFAEARNPEQAKRELANIIQAAQAGAQAGLQINAGHGLHYHNVRAIAAIPEIVELNIGHAIVARALFTGLHDAVREMKRLMLEAKAAGC